MLRFISILLIVAGLAVAAFAGLKLAGPNEVSLDPPPVADEMAPMESAAVETARSAAAVPAPTVSEYAFETATMQADKATALREVPIAHETPDSVLMDTAFEVTLAIDSTGADSASRTLPGQGSVVEGTAMVGEEAKALLTGTNFEIERLSPETQTLSDFAANTWRWRVKAQAEGQHDLVLEIFAMDGARALPVRSYRDTISVQVTTVGRLVNAANEANPIVMLLGGIGSILGGAIGVFRFFRS
ncbi:MAG: hypothetical protein AAGJ32_05500 [Pseudomonadota bacterium]